MEVLLVEPGKEARIAEIGNDLKSLQAAVGGYIEATYPFDDPVALVCNDEGKIMQMPLNRALRAKELQGKYLEKFRWPEKFLTVGGNLVAVQDRPRESTHKQPTQER